MDPILFVTLVFPFAFALIWCGVIGLLATTSGWRAMARDYPAVTDPTGILFRYASATFGRGPLPVQYRNCLNLRVGNEGIGMVPVWILRFMHPAITLPWPAVESCRGGMVYLWPGVEVVVRGGRRFALRGKAGTAVLETWERYQALVGERPDPATAP